MAASVHQLNRSNGGVPKRAVDVVRVTPDGLDGDWQTDRKHHGGPDRAVCLFPVELIRTLQSEGHPITPGSVGENITTEGLEWARVIPGATLQIGDSVLLEITSYTTPCRTIAASFADGEFLRISQKHRPGASRVYARVIAGGTIARGDVITLRDPTM
jgi:MOSC domain-containing protein YiiM